MLSLLAGMLLIWCFKDKRYELAAVFAAVILYFQGYLDYGWRGVALMLLFFAFLEHPGASFLWVLGFMLWWGISGGGGYEVGRSASARRPSRCWRCRSSTCLQRPT